MADLKETDFRKLYNAALLKLERENPEDKSIERVEYVVEKSLEFLGIPKDFPYKDKLILFGGIRELTHERNDIWIYHIDRN